MNAVLYMLLGLMAGIFSGLIGIGKGTIIVKGLLDENHENIRIDPHWCNTFTLPSEA
jgi:hypothetical protein